MRTLERAVGLAGGVCIVAIVAGLGDLRSNVAGVGLADLPAVSTARPSATPVAATAASPPTPEPESFATPAPTAAAAAAIDVAGSPAPAIHIVKRGENLERIARLYGISLQQLATANQITDTSQVYVGQPLIIPSTPPPGAGAAEAAGNEALPSGAGGGSAPVLINSVSIHDFVVMAGGATQNIRRIFWRGLAQGNNPHAFSSVGDSTIEYPYFMTRFDHAGGFNLGQFASLQPAIDYYAGSFDRQSQGVMRGLRASTALDPFWSDKTVCSSNESRIACEYRLNRPAIVFIRLGSNEGQPETFDRYLRQVVDYWVGRGVVPIMGTKADRIEGPDNSDNRVIRQIAIDYELPLWDFDLVAQSVPGGAVGRDGIHLTSFYSYDYTAPEALQRGYGVHNLTALMALDAVWRSLNAGENTQR